jgi:hypothetical protein
MLEEILFGKLALPGELIRILIAVIGTSIAAYYDVFNKKNVPDIMLYAFLGLAFVVNLVFYDPNIFLFSIVTALFFGAIGYVFYRLGQLGGADVFVIVSLMLLLPITPSMSNLPFNLPFIFPVLIFSGVLFATYVILYFGWKLTQNEVKAKLAYALLLIPYALFAYVYMNSFLFSPVYFIFISVLLVASIFFMMFKESLNSLLAEELPVSQLEPEDVAALEIMNKDQVTRYKIPRVLTQSEIDRLKATNVGEIWVYTKLPPFLPFILAGVIIALFFTNTLILLP